MARKSSKEAILNALERVITARGFNQVTLEAVAEEAGISKGGLLYNYSNKKDMFIAMLERHIDRTNALKDEFKKTLPDTGGRDIKAYILARLRNPANKRIAVSKYISMMDDPALHTFLTESKRRELNELGQLGGDDSKLILLLLAAEGLWMMELFNIPALTDERREKILDDLLDMVDECMTVNGAD